MKTSVIITVLNEEATIKQLLMALAKQTRKPAEVIIVDGGSTDGTWAILQAASKNSQNFPLKVYQRSGNRSVGRNYAISQAKHDWIAITDAGCIPHRDWLAQLEKKVLSVAEITRPVVIAGYYDAQPKTDFQAAVVPYFLVMPDRVQADNFLPATRSMILHRQLWQDAGRFNERLSDNEDYEFAQRLLRHERQNLHKILFFTPTAKVTWLPPTTLTQYARTIFRFARGDIKSGIFRPKVGFLFARYVMALLFTLWLIVVTTPVITVCLLLLALSMYSLWAIAKNRRYVPHGWHWLPILQLTADIAVMGGSLAGIFPNLQPLSKRV